ncbi:hypothetical protein FA95DRAFT_1497366 [Auriscalpium vulgare]|uniref:Uncharacterized protein n=1 Tax=Auriscalpium vulgare TaxID=40419 RepID=A0ACB8RJA7_9AGAM|nr:hypothetical protein FA95DRAFT_1497366 [Auriscalpium vulgare]
MSSASSRDGNPEPSGSSSSQPSNHRPHPEAPPPMQTPREASLLPSLKLSIPRQGRLSSATSERCFTYCSQTHRGRAERREPTCRTFCLRSVFAHEVNRTLADAGYHPFLPPTSTSSVPAEIPLSPEADTTVREYYAGQSAEELDDSERGEPGKREHWKEGYYVWLSRNRVAAVEHLAHMKRDLPSQAAYEQSKALWERAIREGREKDFLPTADARLVGNSWRDDMYADVYNPPYTSLLVHVSDPAPQLRKLLVKYLAPSQRLLALARDSVTSGDQAVLVDKMQTAVMSGAPFSLAGTVGKRMWRLLWGEGDGEERG